MKNAGQLNDSKTLRSYSKILLGAVLLILYVWIFTHLYVENIYPRWRYFGFRLGVDNGNSYKIGLICIFAGYIFIPREAKMASDYVLWLLFVLAFVPIQITFGLSDSIPNGGVYYQIALLISFIISTFIARLSGRISWVMQAPNRKSENSRKQTRPGAFKRLFIMASAIVVLLLVFRFRSIMTLAGIEDVYAQRAAAYEFGIGAFFGYLILWVTYLFSPLIIAIGLVEGKKRLIFLAILMFLAIYMITASKTTFVIAAFCISIHFLNRLSLPKNMYLLFFFPIIPMIIAMAFEFSNSTYIGIASAYIVDQIVIRGIAIQAMIFNLYVEFFYNNPVTYYSHVTGISSIIKYPYDLPVGRVISVYQYGNPDANANSGIWATDGVAAAGPIGIIIVGFMLGIFLGFANRFTKNVDQQFLSIAMVPLAMLMVNASLFTTLASGGGCLLVLLVQNLWKDVIPATSMLPA
ncbi:O-antigen polymerase [Sphingobium cupriresistens]|uniref:Oligosaccharide repeat unit polymerase n=1 Tax=Sphingobium cupriresistens TaxID=1132417 RepID=A0A8G1ZEJ6_9SPHN|nr:O-antigen polymerase [Sphingobium cupriresistens]RYM06814.1 oligosaccharide repeat unit polymerase [Sphingobium cupriresistens]